MSDILEDQKENRGTDIITDNPDVQGLFDFLNGPDSLQLLAPPRPAGMR